MKHQKLHENITFNRTFEVQRKTTAPHETADCVNEIGKHVEFTKQYGYGYWLKKVKGRRLAHIEELLKKMKEVENWLKTTEGKKLNRGAWLTNNIKKG